MVKDNVKVIYFKELNSLRFLGFIGIFFGHIFFSTNPEVLNSEVYSLLLSYGKFLGFISLDSFFVLSSFLITWKALEEYEISKKFSFKNFLIRRSLRIWPLYFLIVFFGFSVEYIYSFYTGRSPSLPSFWSFLFFILNFDIIKNGYEFLFFMVFMWSISVEEQFYIFWALVLKWLRKYLITISVVIILCSIIFRIVFIEDNLRLNFHTISCLGNFGIGAIVSLLFYQRSNIILQFQKLSKTIVLLVYVLIFTFFILSPILSNFYIFIIFQRLLFSMFFVFVIVEQTICDNSILKVSNFKFLDYFGKLSYGLYCFHGVIITIVIKLTGTFDDSFFKSVFIYPIIVLVTTIVVSYFSYEFYESKFLKLKSKFYKSNK